MFVGSNKLITEKYFKNSICKVSIIDKVVKIKNIAGIPAPQTIDQPVLLNKHEKTHAIPAKTVDSKVKLSIHRVQST